MNGIPEGISFDIEDAAFMRNALPIPNPGLPSSIGLFGFFCTDCGKVSAGLFIFESDIIKRTVTTEENGEWEYKRPLVKRQRNG